VKLALVQGDEQGILRLMAGVIEVDRDVGDRKALLAAKLDVAFGTPRIERTCQRIDIFGQAI